MDFDRAVAAYIKLRDKTDEVKKRHKEELRPYGELMSRLEATMLDHLNNIGGESLRTEHGTVFKNTRNSVKVADWNVTLPWLVENERWDMLEARVGKEAATVYMEETGEPVPGVEYNSEVTVQVRRPTRKKK